jgi:hypothetical protein
MLGRVVAGGPDVRYRRLPSAKAGRYNAAVAKRAARNVIIASMLFVCCQGMLRSQQAVHARVSTCERLQRPGYGVSYRGTVGNDDYRFSVTIPAGLVGWGAGPGAPFHGFAIFIGPRAEASSCIVFQIGIHVDLEEDTNQPEPGEERVKVGNRVGTKTSSAGSVRGTFVENVNVRLELPREGYKNDVTIVLITSKAEAPTAKDVFAKFLASFRFY